MAAVEPAPKRAPEMIAAPKGPPTPVADTAIPRPIAKAPPMNSGDRIRSLWAVHQWLIGSVM
mgnify:FL=1